MWSIHKTKNSNRWFILKKVLRQQAEHHLSTIKIEKKSLPINLLTDNGLIENKIGKKFHDGDRIWCKTLL